MNDDARVLILGASGFIGQEVLRALLRYHPKIHVSILLRQPAKTESGIRIFQGDIRSFDWHQLDEEPPDRIIHLARINARRFGKWGRKRAAFQGRRANQRLLNHIQKNNWGTHVTYVSGSLMYGEMGAETADEKSPVNPVSFAREYVEAEKPFLQSDRVQMIRLPWVFGKGSWFQSFYLKSMRDCSEIPVYGTGQSRMSFIHVRDAGKLIAEIALKEGDGTFNLCMEEILTQKGFCRLIEEISGMPLQMISNVELRNKFGRAVYEAFTCSIPLKSRYQEEFNKLAEYISVKEMLREELPQLLS
ncbi:MAG: NAD-dependent epimerase/dehydratase family protein [Bacteroidetes bacterium]|nr:NAD-dependent epimerase/dehydratase family protein [Bacteroidota bacterium]